jgi:hypothetical protein
MGYGSRDKKEKKKKINERQIKDTQKQADSLKHHFEERNINFLNYNQRVE